MVFGAPRLALEDGQSTSTTERLQAGSEMSIRAYSLTTLPRANDSGQVLTWSKSVRA